MHPILLQLGPITVYSYGAMMALGFLAATYLTSLGLERNGYKGDIASSLVVYAAVGGLAGARLWAVLNDLATFDAADWVAFDQHPLVWPFAAVCEPGNAFWGCRLLRFTMTGSGFVYYGGLIGGFLSVSWGIYRNRVPWGVTVDCIAPGLVLAHALGRIGCELAGDGDWGKPSTLPWARAYPNAIIGWDEWVRNNGYAPDVRVHPTPLYEAAVYTAIAALLWRWNKEPHAPGTTLAWYFILGSTARFLVEFIRINPRVALDLTQAQWTAIALVTLGVVMLLVLRLAPASAAGATPRPAK